MKIHYISHACLFCETNNLRIVMDPWFDQPAYRNQWHIYPNPASHAPLEEAEAIAISHGHEDHLHYPTLQACNKQASVYHPLQFNPGSEAMFKGDLGFKAFHELPGNHTVSIGENAKITFVPVGHDSVIILEADDEVLVNVNDALHSAPVEVITHTTAYLNKRFPKIDYMFCGYGGASYYPNCIHTESKDDGAIALLRECLFARNFCLVAHELQPRIAVPFAADFVLKHEHLRWINATRFDRNRMPDLYDRLFSQQGPEPKILPLVPGQTLEGSDVQASRFGQPVYKPLGAGFQDPDVPVDAVAKPYAELIRKNLSNFRGRPFRFNVTIRGVGETRHINVNKTNGQYAVEISGRQAEGADLTCEMSAANVEHLLRSAWNSDVVIIGYAIDIHAHNMDAVRNGAIDELENLLTHYPNLRQSMRRHPVRAVRYVAANMITRSRLRQKLMRQRRQEPFSDVPRRDWLQEPSHVLSERLGLPTDYERFGYAADQAG